MTDLIARLESADVGSRELDAHIWAVTCTRVDFSSYRPEDGYEVRFEPEEDGSVNCYFVDVEKDAWNRIARRDAPPFSTSLDAALTLVPEGCGWKVTQRLDGLKCDALIQHRADNGIGFDIWIDIEAATPALALTIASLKARQA